MTDFRRVTDGFSVAPQISLEDLPTAAAQGFKLVINNRPDGEEAGQPDGESIRAAAEAAGLAYTAIPVTQAGFSRPQVDAMIAAISAATFDEPTSIAATTRSVRGRSNCVGLRTATAIRQ